MSLNMDLIAYPNETAEYWESNVANDDNLFERFIVTFLLHTLMQL